MQPIIYYFSEESLRDCFESCIQALFAELSTEKAINLTHNVKISEEIIERETNDGEIMIDSAEYLKQSIETIVETFEIDIAELFLSEKEIKSQADTILQKLEQQEIENDHKMLVKDFSVSYTQGGNMNQLFNVLFSRNAYMEDREGENIPQFDNFNYDKITNKIDQILQVIKDDHFPTLEWEFDHLGGDTAEGNEYLDLYYRFFL